MKKIIFCMLFLGYVLTIHAQVETKTTPTREQYLQKSKSQKLAAFILLGAGATAFAIAAPGNVSFDVLPTLVIGGGLAVIGSIPLFLASAKNKGRAKRLSAFFKTERFPTINGTGMIMHRVPALSITIKI